MLHCSAACQGVKPWLRCASQATQLQAQRTPAALTAPPPERADAGQAGSAAEPAAGRRRPLAAGFHGRDLRSTLRRRLVFPADARDFARHRQSSFGLHSSCCTWQTTQVSRRLQRLNWFCASPAGGDGDTHSVTGLAGKLSAFLRSGNAAEPRASRPATVESLRTQLLAIAVALFEHGQLGLVPGLIALAGPLQDDPALQFLQVCVMES